MADGDATDGGVDPSAGGGPDAPVEAAARRSRLLGVAGGSAGLAASLFVLFGPVVRFRTERSTGAVTTGTVSGVDYLLGSPHAELALLAWPLAVGVAAAVGGWAAWRRRRAWTWAAALTVAGFAGVAVMSIGGLYLPAALLLLAAAAVRTTRRSA